MFVSIDLETTGTDESYCQILEVGIVLETGEYYHRKIWYDRLIGQPVALAMNAGLIADMDKRVSFEGGYWLREKDLAWDLQDFLHRNKIGHNSKATVVGKNFGSFDRRFLAKLSGHLTENFHSGFIDIGNLYYEWSDTQVPNTDECAKRAGIDRSKYRLHSAIDDATMMMDMLKIWRSRQKG